MSSANRGAAVIGRPRLEVPVRASLRGGEDGGVEEEEDEKKNK